MFDIDSYHIVNYDSFKYSFHDRIMDYIDVLVNILEDNINIIRFIFLLYISF